jgi:hypothetical protein
LTGAAFSTYGRVTVLLPGKNGPLRSTTGASFTAVTLTVVVATLDRLCSDWPSLTCTVTVRSALPGLSVVFLKVIDWITFS